MTPKDEPILAEQGIGWQAFRASRNSRSFFEAGGLPMQLPDIELVSAKAHDAWMASKRAAGIHSRKSEGGEELMVPYDQLSEAAKDLDRAMVKAVYAAIRAAWDAQS
jgi:hypothetical protein